MEMIKNKETRQLIGDHGIIILYVRDNAQLAGLPVSPSCGLSHVIKHNNAYWSKVCVHGY